MPFVPVRGVPEHAEGPLVPDLLLELGTEDLPPGDVGPASAQLAQALRAALDSLRLTVREVAAFATPRRLTVLASDLAARQGPAERRVRGPAAAVAFHSHCPPTHAPL